jgi:hypothetical protein
MPGGYGWGTVQAYLSFPKIGLAEAKNISAYQLASSNQVFRPM